MLEWITDPNVQAVSDQIEEVNRKMFEKIRSRNDNLVVFFCKFTYVDNEEEMFSQLGNIISEALLLIIFMALDFHEIYRLTFHSIGL